MSDLNDVRLIAFYLPQYHPIPENDLWWGKGFTEWTNVTKAKPNFDGHYQPHLPADLGFYDLRVPEVREQQADLAKQYGINGFCYHYYWFGGKRLLERPLDEVLASGRPDFPFCICWANENWTRRWDGMENEVLIAQNHSLEDDKAFIRSLIPAFVDPRYIRVHGKPLLIIYRISLLPDPVRTIKAWRKECLDAGIGEIYLCVAQSFGIGDPRPYGCDAAVEFPPHGINVGEVTKDIAITNPSFEGRIYNYEGVVQSSLSRAKPDYKLFRALIPSWDNTPRRQNAGHMFINSRPESYRFWLSEIIKRTRQAYLGDEKLVFINAWNEWGEGCHLEPDKKYGHQFLEATLDAVNSQSLNYTLTHSKFDQPELANSCIDIPLVSICIPTCNGDSFLREALESVASQTYSNIEVIVSDDCSSDSTVQLLEEFQNLYPGDFLILIHERYGLVENWNFCIDKARGKYIKFLFQDDLMDSQCVQKMVDLAEKDESVGLVFSRRKLILDSSGEGDKFCQTLYKSSGNAHQNWSNLQELQSGQELLNDPVLVEFLGYNMIGEPSTVLIRRDCFVDIGLFDIDLKQVVDLDMWYRIMGKWSIGFINEELSGFRIHLNQESRKNSASGKSREDVFRLWKKIVETDSYNFFPHVLKLAAQQNLLNAGVNQAELPFDLDVSVQLSLAQAEISRLKTRISAMESSKFWGMRRLWFRLKRLFTRGNGE